jgi:flagellar biogenesis protein FliO
METTRQVLAVVFVLALLGAALWALRRGAGPLQARRRGQDKTHDKTQALQIVDRIALTPQHSLHVVRAGACEWILVTHPQGCTIICEGKSSGAAA